MTKTDEIHDTAAPLIEHLKELRNRIIYCLIALTIGFFIGYMLWKPIFAILAHPMCQVMADRGEQCQLVLIKMQEGFFVSLKIAMWGALFMSFPFLAYQMWRFVAPGLYRSEKGAFLPFLLASPLMFIAGASFCYFVILPWAFQFFLGFQDSFTTAVETGTPLANAPAGVVFNGSMEAYLSLTMSFVLAFGLTFQLPVLLTLMGRAGLISSKGLKATRKYAVVGILAIAATVTPPDIMSQLILFAAVYPLYEVSIWLIARFEKQREAKERANGTWVDIEDEDAA